MRSKMLLFVCLAAITGCGPSTAPPASTPTQAEVTPTPTLAPATPTPDPCDPHTAPTPTPLPEATPGGPSFDPDIFPPIDVSHYPPAVLHSDEKALLQFMFVCGISDEPVSCHTEETLYVGWGDGPFKPVEMQPGEVDVWARVPATDESGRPLRYYVEARDPQHNVGVRFPTSGCFEPLVVPSLIEIELPAPQPVEAEVALSLPWGQGEGQVGVNPAAMVLEGPSAFDVGPNGTLAILDNVNSRVIVAYPGWPSRSGGGGGMSSFPLTDFGWGDIAVDPSGQIAVMDASGEPEPGSVIRVPRVSLYQPDGTLVAEAPVFAKLPYAFTGPRAVIDGNDQRLVTPFDDQGRALSRDEQRAARTAPDLQVDWHDLYIQLADVPNGLAFDISARGGLGWIHLIERAAEGYLAVFQDTGVFRILRFDTSGEVLSYVEIEATGIEWGSSRGLVAAGDDGSVYIMNNAGETVQILRVSAPSR